jgi:hypothetical protein
MLYTIYCYNLQLYQFLQLLYHSPDDSVCLGISRGYHFDHIACFSIKSRTFYTRATLQVIYGCNLQPYQVKLLSCYHVVHCDQHRQITELDQAFISQKITTTPNAPLPMGPISYSVSPYKPFLPSVNVTLSFIGPIPKL